MVTMQPSQNLKAVEVWNSMQACFVLANWDVFYGQILA